MVSVVQLGRQTPARGPLVRQRQDNHSGGDQGGRYECRIRQEVQTDRQDRDSENEYPEPTSQESPQVLRGLIPHVRGQLRAELRIITGKFERIEIDGHLLTVIRVGITKS